ncbi:hypothetical protein R3P38DRAFT_192107 [Favolaschia claudopus]|uniref:DUF6534 domain-containing protein n=1 Tax=Favolaschia claudopus TaxID=2862362 RepID=A0AAW0D4A3_9AGAR
MSQYLLLTAPILAGTQANWALAATLLLQVCRFLTYFPNERRWIKTLVCAILLLELTQTGVSSHYAYWVLCLGWGDEKALAILPWSCLATPVFTGITAGAVQTFFSWRIYLLMSRTIWACAVAGVIFLLAIAQAVMIFVVVGQFSQSTEFANVVKITSGVRSWLIITTVCDILTTSTLIIIFYQYRIQMPWEERRTDTFISKLMLNTVETGAVTTFTAIIYLILFLVYPLSNLEETPTFILGKVYANVLVFTLNARYGGARRRFWTNDAIPVPQQTVGEFTSIYLPYSTDAVSTSECTDATP